MNKKIIISNTVTFLGIILFINVFQSIFGAENILVGITIITATLMYMERDLTIEPMKNLGKLLVVNLLQGILAFWASSNMWIGIPVNLISIFLIAYFFSYDIRSAMVLPYGLQYLFMIFTPVYGEAYLNRIFALIFGALLIMAVQFVVNKNKVVKSGEKIISSLCEELLKKSDLIYSNEDLKEENIKIEGLIKNLKKILYDNRINDYYMSNGAYVITNTLWSLEKKNLILDSLKGENEFSQRNLQIEEIKKNLEVIKEQGYNMDDKVGKVNSDREIPRAYRKRHVHKRDFRLDSLKVRYGVKLSVAITLAVFITEYFNISEGRWMVYTIFSLVQPYYENCKSRAGERLQGTVIGAIIVLISFTLIQDTTARYGIVILAGYLNPFAKEYKNLIIWVTVSAIGSSALGGGTLEFVVNRIVLVFIGACIALIVNKFILPFTLEDGKNRLIKMYESLIEEMKREINSENCGHAMKNLYLIPALIEDRMKITKFGNECNKEREYIYNNRKIVNSIYNYHFSNNSQDVDRNFGLEISNEFEKYTTSKNLRVE